MATLHLLVKGKVQGVFYRATAKAVADGLGITGWIKNTPDGSVEVVVTGDEKQLQDFGAWCRQGPPKAKVLEVVSNACEGMQFKEFSILR